METNPDCWNKILNGYRELEKNNVNGEKGEALLDRAWKTVWEEKSNVTLPEENTDKKTAVKADNTAAEAKQKAAAATTAEEKTHPPLGTPPTPKGGPAKSGNYNDYIQGGYGALYGGIIGYVLAGGIGGALLFGGIGFLFVFGLGKLNKD